MRLSVAEIAGAVGGACVGADATVEGVNWDSRLVQAGDMYVALPGERVDGHDFVGAAAANGAACALVTHEVEADIPLIVVDDTAAALTRLSAYWRSKLEGVVIGLTGSVGKTSTKNLVRDVLSHAHSVVATLANQNNELGVPNTLLAADVDTDAVVVEMGMRGRGQITELCEIAHPDWGIITNVGESHIELLGSRDNIARAKAELFECLPNGRGIAFVNASDDYASQVCDYAKLDERNITTVFYGGASASGDAPSVWASEVEFDDESRPSFVLNAQNMPIAFGNVVDSNSALCVSDSAATVPVSTNRLGEHKRTRNTELESTNSLTDRIACKLELRGAHSVTNACAAAAVGLVSGMTLEQVRDALAAAQPEKGRQQITHTQAGITVFDDSYNASPDSMQASLNTFTSMAVEGKRVAVLGDMLELGDFSKECHERVGIMAANAHVDRLVCVGELSRHMARAAEEAGIDPQAIQTCDNAEEALALILPILEPGDAVLAKASHSIGLDRIVKELVS